MSWHDDLDTKSAAYEIAASKNSHVRVVAGPGAGKSFAMKRRVARLLESGINPESILPVTFTKVAAEDLHRELVGMKVAGCSELVGTTLHSLALKKLMRNHVLLATGRTPRPLNEFEIRPLEADLHVYGGLRDVRKLIKAYESAWARLQNEDPGFAQTPEEQSFSSSLVSWLRFHKAMLIGEVIPRFYEYLRSNPLAHERNEYTHILVDEFQDLNKAEQSTIDLLSQKANICVIGDDDQSIYSFKHAHPEGIQQWASVHEGADDLTLTECRRCPKTVVEMANNLISHNKQRPNPKYLAARPENGDGDVRIIQYASLDAEISGVADLALELITNGENPGNILILAQRNIIGTPIYEQLLSFGVPVKSYYAESELDNEEVQRRFSLFKLFINHEDRVSLRWLLGLGSKNWCRGSYALIRDYCDAHNTSPWDVLHGLTTGNISISRTNPLVSRFRIILSEIEYLEHLAKLQDVVNHLFPENDKSVRDIRVKAINILNDINSEDRLLFLSELMSAITAPEIPSEVQEIRIMSLHKSKGLSAPVTIIAGCVEGLLPMRPDSGISALAQDAYTEEQRRLFYVGISRVKASPANGIIGKLILTYSSEMPLSTAMSAGIQPADSRFGIAKLHASRFIHELGPSAPQPIAHTRTEIGGYDA